MKTIRGKMTALMLGLCFVVLAMVWLLTYILFAPAYYRMIDKQLSGVADTLTQILIDPSATDGATTSVLDGLQLQKNGICVEVATISAVDVPNTPIIYYEGIGDSCGIHHEGDPNFFGSEPVQINSTTAIALRLRAREEGNFSVIIPNNARDGEQYVVARYVPEINGTIIVSTNLERVEQAMGVFRRQLMGITIAVTMVSILAAVIVSRWLTKPITQLATAAQEIADGNYEVSVPVTTHDELGNLAKEFNAMASEVNKTDKLQKELVANFSHDLRTPLTLIKGYAETVRDLTGDNEFVRNDQLNVIIDESDRLSSLVSSAMEFSKYASGIIEVKEMTFDINELIEDTAMRYNRIYEQSGYKIQTKLCDNSIVKADAAMMERVLDNLMVNAISHVGEDKEVLILAQDVPAGVKVTIEDHGDGIAPDELPHLFDRYYRARTSEGKVGTGLGLSIVKAILNSHKFEFGVESELGKGSQFWFIIKQDK